ncbi:MAG: transcriptional regulator [Nocardioides sp.]
MRRPSRRQLSQAHDDFISTGVASEQVRPLVADSWRRSIADGLDPEAALPPVELSDDALDSWRAAHPLADAMPMVRRLLLQDAKDSGFVVAVSDAAGRLMWVEGPTRLKLQMETIHFMEGARWSEQTAGTNAPGTALALDAPVQIVAAEHLIRTVTDWSCAASPIHDPDTGAMIGALDITGGDAVAAPQVLSVVRATVAAIERELQVQRLLRRETHPVSSVQLRTLGLGTAILDGPHGSTRLSLRHSELLLLLSEHRDGMSGEELMVALHDEDLAPVTLRAELSRLRGTLSSVGLSLDGRPYRLDSRVTSDLDQLRDRVRTGDLSSAVDLYRGDVLPLSDAPGVRRLRDRVRGAIRTALLQGQDPDALLRFADTEHGRDDWELWQGAQRMIGQGSPRSGRVRDHLSALERDLG